LLISAQPSDIRQKISADTKTVKLFPKELHKSSRKEDIHQCRFSRVTRQDILGREYFLSLYFER
jgi:hypothetical protein